MNEYKIKQLMAMLMVETDPNPEISGYGAHLQYWTGDAKPINIDAGALQVLIDYYSGKETQD